LVASDDQTELLRDVEGVDGRLRETRREENLAGDAVEGVPDLLIGNLGKHRVDLIMSSGASRRSVRPLSGSIIYTCSVYMQAGKSTRLTEGAKELWQDAQHREQLRAIIERHG
jgi:hypothetical protein